MGRRRSDCATRTRTCIALIPRPRGAGSRDSPDCGRRSRPRPARSRNGASSVRSIRTSRAAGSWRTTRCLRSRHARRKPWSSSPAYRRCRQAQRANTARSCCGWPMRHGPATTCPSNRFRANRRRKKQAAPTKLMTAVREVAGNLGIGTEVLATRRDVEALAYGSVAPETSPLLRGWRRGAIGEQLAQML